MGSDGRPQEFKWTMLSDVIRQLRATPEMCMMAWSQSLDYNIGTSAHTFAAMTAVCEHFGVTISDWAMLPGAPASRQHLNTQHLTLPDRSMCNSDEEYHMAKMIYLEKLKEQNPNQCEVSMKSVLSYGGLTRADRLEMLRKLERQRRCTSIYRHACMISANSMLEMDDPCRVIDKIMSEYPAPLGCEPPEQFGDLINTIPVYASCIVGDCVTTSVIYEFKNVKKWTFNKEVRMEYKNPSMARANLNFSERRQTGPSRYNLAWVRKEAKTGWYDFAKQMRSENNSTCNLFDIPQNSLKDILYLMSTSDNYRRCTEEPRLPIGMSVCDAFIDDQDNAVVEQGGGNVRFRGTVDKRADPEFLADEVLPGDERARAPPRHPFACVPDSDFQRRLDYQISSARLPAIVSFYSNNVRDSAPVRMLNDGENKAVELSMSAAAEHTRMLYEAVMRCSLQPGMDGMHETFSGSATAPDCLSMPSGATQASDQHCKKLPYCYDVINIAITLDVTSRLYNSEAGLYVKMYNEEYSDLDFRMDAKDLPHTALRYVGLEDTKNRKFLSLEPRTEADPLSLPCEVGDQRMDEVEETRAFDHYQLKLGRSPTEAEFRNHVSKGGGSSYMSGITGNAFDFSVYRKHAIASMKERGMISGLGDPLVGIVSDDACNIRYRVGELAAKKIQEYVDENYDSSNVDDMIALDSHATPQEREEAKKRLLAEHRASLYSTVELPPELNDFRHHAHISLGSNRKLSYHNQKKNEEAERQRRRNKKRQSSAHCDGKAVNSLSPEESYRMSLMRPRVTTDSGPFDTRIRNMMARM